MVTAEPPRDRGRRAGRGAPGRRRRNRDLDAGSLREQLGRLGNTAYALDELEIDLRGAPFVPASLLNQLRREAVDLLSEEQAQRPSRSRT